MPRGYAKGQQSSMPVDAVLGFPERHVSDKPLHCTFEVSCLVMGWGFKQNMRQGLPANRLRQELRCTWLRNGLEHSWGWEM